MTTALPNKNYSGHFKVAEKEHLEKKALENAGSMTLKPNTHRRRRRDETVEYRRVGGVYTNSQLVGDCFVVSSV